MSTLDNISRVFTLDPEHNFFSFRGWLFLGPEVESVVVFVQFMNTARTVTFARYNNYGVEEPESGWSYWAFDDMPRPTGAEVAIVSFSLFSPTEVFAGTLIDDLSFMGNTVSPVRPPVLEPLELPEQEPILYSLESNASYEWRVRVTDEGHVTSDWSDIGRFWVVAPPNSGPTLVEVGETLDGATLGCGKHRVFVYRRGGKVRVGELTQLSYVEWNRVRDDISDAKVTVSGWDVDCGNLLSRLESWAYELVIYRDSGHGAERVWEGPLTLPTWENDKVTINAKDPIVYLYRRIIKQAMNDFGSSPTAGRSVIQRAAAIIQNVLAPDDPNLLAYLTLLARDDDAKQYRSLPAYSRTAYEEVDDMAANAGLDYTAVGRRIMLWGTKHRIGTLPEFRDENLGSSPIVSEYGMSMANRYAVSDGNGVYGEATRLDENGQDLAYGLVEMLSSSWATDSESDTGTYTEAGLETVRKSFAKYAERSIADRYPPPLVVRIPDNTTLHPNTPISIQHLVPGVVIPLRSTKTLRKVRANQKLDSVKVIETKDNETISVTMSPFNRDDAEIVEEEAG